MSNSSQDQNSSIDLINESLITIGGTGTDTFTIELPQDLYTNTSYVMASNMYNSNTTYTIAGGSGSSDISFNWGTPKTWVDSFPEWHRVQDMCKEYPGLEIAFRNFKTFYELVKDDYDNPTPKK